MYNTRAKIIKGSAGFIKLYKLTAQALKLIFLLDELCSLIKASLGSFTSSKPCVYNNSRGLLQPGGCSRLPRDFW